MSVSSKTGIQMLSSFLMGTCQDKRPTFLFRFVILVVVFVVSQKKIDIVIMSDDIKHCVGNYYEECWKRDCHSLVYTLTKYFWWVLKVGIYVTENGQISWRNLIRKLVLWNNVNSYCDFQYYTVIYSN